MINRAHFADQLARKGDGLVLDGHALGEIRRDALAVERHAVGAVAERRGDRLAAAMNALALPGLYFRPTAFTPTFSKWQGEMCRGVQMHVTDRETCDAFAGGLFLMDEIRRQAGDRFEFIHWGEDPQYSVDKLLGTDRYRTGQLTAREMVEAYREPVREFARRAEQYQLYR